MADSVTQTCKVLWLTGSRSGAPAAVEQFVAGADVHRVSSFAEAMEAMRRHRFDFVLSEQCDFIALERAVGTQQASVTLESIGQGVCIVDENGRLLYTNTTMRSYPTDLTSLVCQQCRRAFTQHHRSPDAAPASLPHHRARRFSLTAGNDQHFEVTATPVLNEQQALSQIVAVVWDVTGTRRLQHKIDAIDRAGRELVQLGAEATAQLHIEDRIKLLEQKIFQSLHDLLHFDNFAVLLIDKKSNRLEFVLQHGMCERSKELDIYVSTDGNGISGYVAATGRSYICGDILTDPRYLPGLEAARSSLTVPLFLQDKVIGVFNIESEQVAAFNEEDRQFTEILGRYVAIALNTLDLLVTERYQTTGRLADDVSSEIAAPLNDILTEAATLMEEYIGHDDLRRRLGAICDNVALIKRSIREVASAKGGILGRRDAPIENDPILGGKRVLVADDEEIIRDTIAGVLMKHGCEVETAPDGAAAIALLENRTYDVVLADIKMPHKNGYEIYAAAKQQNSATPVILMTGFGYDPNHSIVRASKEGLNGVLFKPFKVDQLLEEVRAALSGATA